jgi:hypothetical protein
VCKLGGLAEKRGKASSSCTVRGGEASFASECSSLFLSDDVYGGFYRRKVA